MNRLLSFAPWIAYPAAAGFFGWRTGAIVALAVAVIGIARDGRPAASDPLRATAVVFFGALTAVSLADPASALHRFVPALAPAALAAGAFVSIAAGNPFTVAFAKKVAPREFWDTPLFAHVNLVLTTVWAASFAAMAAVIATTLVVAPHAILVIFAAQIAGFVVPMRITRSYPARARDHYLAA